MAASPVPNTNMPALFSIVLPAAGPVTLRSPIKHVLRGRSVASGEDMDRSAFDAPELRVGQSIAAAGEAIADQRLGAIGRDQPHQPGSGSADSARGADVDVVRRQCNVLRRPDAIEARGAAGAGLDRLGGDRLRCQVAPGGDEDIASGRERSGGEAGPGTPADVTTAGGILNVDQAWRADVEGPGRNEVGVDDQIAAGRQTDCVGADRSDRDGERPRFVMNEIVGRDGEAERAKRAVVGMDRYPARRLHIEAAGGGDVAVHHGDHAGESLGGIGVDPVRRHYQTEAVDRDITVDRFEKGAASQRPLAAGCRTAAAGGNRSAGDDTGVQSPSLAGQVQSVGGKNADKAGDRVAAEALERVIGVEPAIAADGRSIEEGIGDIDRRASNQQRRLPAEGVTAVAGKAIGSTETEIPAIAACRVGEGDDGREGRAAVVDADRDIVSAFGADVDETAGRASAVAGIPAGSSVAAAAVAATAAERRCGHGGQVGSQYAVAGGRGNDHASAGRRSAIAAIPAVGAPLAVAAGAALGLRNGDQIAKLDQAGPGVAVAGMDRSAARDGIAARAAAGAGSATGVGRHRGHPVDGQAPILCI